MNKDDDDDDDDQGHAGLTTSWRGLTSRVLICYTSHETEALTHPRSQPSQSDDGEVTCHDMTDELSTRDSMGYFYGAPCISHALSASDTAARHTSIAYLMSYPSHLSNKISRNRDRAIEPGEA